MNTVGAIEGSFSTRKVIRFKMTLFLPLGTAEDMALLSVRDEGRKHLQCFLKHSHNTPRPHRKSKMLLSLSQDSLLSTVYN